MKKLILSLGVLVAVASVFAQRGMGMMGGMSGNPIMILNRADVQADLGLTDDQKDKLSTLLDPQSFFPKMQAAMQEAGLSFQDMRSEEGRKKMEPIMTKMMADTQKEVDAVLTPNQSKRLKEISIQFNGNRSVLNKDIQKALEVTDDQKSKLDALQKASGEAMRALGEKMRNQELTREEMQEKIKSNEKIMDDEIGKILTAAQKGKLSELGGKKFVRNDDL